MRSYNRFILIICLFISLWAAPSQALKPSEILVLANRNAAKSVELARYYMTRRGIPDKNLLILWITDKEACTREAYNRKIAKPVKQYFVENADNIKIRCILTIYGLPLKISEDKEQSGTAGRAASLDSELALIQDGSYALEGWVPNPFFVPYGNKYEKRRDKVLMVSRLDGPSDKIVRRLIDDSIEAEQEGLNGIAYFDARWPEDEQNKEKGMGYQSYDLSIHKSADLFEKKEYMPVVLNDNQELFPEGYCKDAAIYCGWYSLGNYIDSFEWRKGSVGYHIASSECTTLKQPGSQVWCKRMLEEGVAATIGPVNEPYIQAFPIPELFFKVLLDGYWSLAECYALSQPFWSWQMVLIGDPLYRPFEKMETTD